MTYLVTGGAGFIGSHLAGGLVALGKKVRILDNFSSGKRENIAALAGRIEVVEGDIRDVGVVQEAMSGVRYVSHQAALRSVPKSMSRPLEYHDVNVSGVLNVLTAARDRGVRRVVFASSSSVYGNTQQFPQSEGQESFPISPYALTKKMGEDYCRLFADVYGVSTISLRYFNVYGPQQSLEDDYAVVVPKFITSLLNGETPPIYGDGLQSRDFTYVSDVVAANLAALHSDKGMGCAYNVANGKSHSVLDLLKVLCAKLGITVEPKFLPPRPGDVRKTHADVHAIANDLGWRAGLGFEEGLAQTVAWFKERHSGKGKHEKRFGQ